VSVGSLGSHPQACGDKFLVVGRGARYARPNAPPRSASVLIYRDVDSQIPTSAIDLELESTLLHAGHQFRVVGSIKELDDALGMGKFDVVLVNLAGAPAIQDHLQSALNRPAVLPIVYSPQGTDVSAAKKQYGSVVKHPDKRNDLLAAIDE